MITKRSLLLALAILLGGAAWTMQSPRSIFKESSTNRVSGPDPMIAFAAAPRARGGPIRRLGGDSAFPLEEPLAELTPTNVNMIETLETPLVVSVTIPRDANRTHFLLSVNGAHLWHQVPTPSPYSFTGAYRVVCSSEVLPSPGSFSFGLGFDGQIEAEASTKDIQYVRDPLGTLALDGTVLAPILSFHFAGLTEEEALDLAHDLIRSESAMSVKVRVRMRSVQTFTLNNAFLQVWGD